MNTIMKFDGFLYWMILIFYCLMAFLTSTIALQCSCYTFYRNTTKRDWDISRKECKANGGDLVAMEHEQEWDFIKTQIQTRTTSSGFNQWWIGLTRDEGVWKWINGYNLTYSRWKTGLNLYSKRSHAIIENDQGTIWNTYWYDKMGSICENKVTDCEARQVRWCDITSTNVTTLRDHTTVTLLKNKTSRDVVKTFSVDPSAGHTSRQVVVTSTSSEKDELEGRREDRMDRKGNEKLILQPMTTVRTVCNEKITQDAVYATVGETKDTNTTTTVPEYAVVKHPPKKREEELNYAVLSDFTNDGSHDVVKPSEYQDTEYAILDVM